MSIWRIHCPLKRTICHFCRLRSLNQKNDNKRRNLMTKVKKCRIMGFVYLTFKQLQTDTDIQDKEYVYSGLLVRLSSEDGYINYIVCTLSTTFMHSSKHQNHCTVKWTSLESAVKKVFKNTKYVGLLFRARLLYWITLCPTSVLDIVKDVICYWQELIIRHCNMATLKTNT